MTSQAAKFVGSIPEHYDRALGPILFVEYGRQLGHLVAQQQPNTVLELASGTGISTRCLRDALPSGCRLVASDLNAPMLDVAKQKFNTDEKVEFKIVDASSIPLDDATLDVVACQFGVMFLPNKVASHREVHRVLKPGGSYVFSLWDSWEKNPFAQIAHETTASFFTDNPPGFYKVPFHYHETDEITDALNQAGFSDVTIERTALDQVVPSFSEFSQGLVFGNPLHDEIVARGGTSSDIVKTAICDAMHKSFGPDGSSMPLQAIFVTATK